MKPHKTERIQRNRRNKVSQKKGAKQAKNSIVLYTRHRMVSKATL